MGVKAHIGFLVGLFGVVAGSCATIDGGELDQATNPDPTGVPTVSATVSSPPSSVSSSSVVTSVVPTPPSVITLEPFRYELAEQGLVRLAGLDDGWVIVESLIDRELPDPDEEGFEGFAQFLRGNGYVAVDPLTGVQQTVNVDRTLDTTCAKPSGTSVGRSGRPGTYLMEIACLRPEDNINLVEVEWATGEAVATTLLSDGDPPQPVSRIEPLGNGDFLVTTGGICNSLGIYTPGEAIAPATVEGLEDVTWDLQQGFKLTTKRCDVSRDGGFDDITVSDDGNRVAALMVERSEERPVPGDRVLRTGVITDGAFHFDAPLVEYDDVVAVEFVGSCLVLNRGFASFELLVISPQATVTVPLPDVWSPQDMTHIPGTTNLVVGWTQSDRTDTLDVFDLSSICSP